MLFRETKVYNNRRPELQSRVNLESASFLRRAAVFICKTQVMVLFAHICTIM